MTTFPLDEEKVVTIDPTVVTDAPLALLVTDAALAEVAIDVVEIGVITRMEELVAALSLEETVAERIGEAKGNAARDVIE